MSEGRRAVVFWRNLSVAMIVLLAVVAALVASPTFEACISQERQQSAAEQNKKGLAHFPVALVGGLGSVYVCAGEFADKNEPAITAVGTIFVAVFTGTLWAATWRLWASTEKLVSGAEDTAERQLRAYLSIPKARIRDVEAGKRPVGTLTFKNVGATPAYDLNFHVAMGLMHYPPRESEFANVPPASMISLAPVSPQQTVKGDATLSKALEENQMAALTDGRGALYVIGRINFADAFGKPRYKMFRLMYTHRLIAAGSNKMEVCPTGNDED